MLTFFAAVAVLSLASVTANLSTPRAQPRLSGAVGWSLTAGLAAAGIALLSQTQGVVEAVAVALVVLMTGIAGVSAGLALRRRQRARRVA